MLNNRAQYVNLSVFIRYVLVGFINLFVCVIMMRLGLFLGLSYLSYTFLGYAAAMFNSFLLNSYFTFSFTDDACGQAEGRRQHFNSHQLRWFLLINTFNLASVEGIEYILIEKIDMLELPTILIGMVWYTLLGFLMNQRYVFKKSVVQHEN